MAPELDVLLSYSPLDAVPRARALEAAGVDGVFTFENAHDLFLPLAAAAPICSLDLMTNVAIAFPRSPMHLAQTANDLQLLSGGRFRLGLGTQVRAHVEHRYGARWERPVAKMREWVLAVKEIQAAWQEGRSPEFRGEFTRHTLMTPAFDPGPNPHGPPKVLVGALGPRMTAMAAEVADGLLVMPFNSRRHLAERTRPAIASGLEAAGRTRADVELVGEVIVGVGRTDAEREAAQAVRWLLAFYASTPAYRPVLDLEGWGDLQPELNALSKRGEWATMAERVTDEMVDTITAFGGPDEVAAEIVARFGDCDRVCAYFPGYDVADDLLVDLVDALRAAG